MKRNVEINGLGPSEEEITAPDGQQSTKSNPGKVRVHEDDAWYVHFFDQHPRLTWGVSVL